MYSFDPISLGIVNLKLAVKIFIRADLTSGLFFLSSPFSCFFPVGRRGTSFSGEGLLLSSHEKCAENH